MMRLHPPGAAAALARLGVRINIISLDKWFVIICNTSLYISYVSICSDVFCFHFCLSAYSVMLFFFSPLPPCSGEVLGFENLVFSIFEFVHALLENNKFKSTVKKALPELIYYILLYMQITEEQVSMFVLCRLSYKPP